MVRALIIFILLVLIIIVSPIALIAGALFWDWITYPKRVRSLIPQKIQTLNVVSNDYSVQIGGGGDCGGLAFKLSKRTLGAIKEQGISYFDNAAPTNPVVYRGRTDYWRPWQKKSGYNEVEDNARIPFGCVLDFENFLKKDNYEMNDISEAYYTFVTHRGRSNLWVFPEWGIIVYSYSY